MSSIYGTNCFWLPLSYQTNKSAVKRVDVSSLAGGLFLCLTPHDVTALKENCSLSQKCSELYITKLA
jgi:hypothetical protein